MRVKLLIILMVLVVTAVSGQDRSYREWNNDMHKIHNDNFQALTKSLDTYAQINNELQAQHDAAIRNSEKVVVAILMYLESLEDGYQIYMGTTPVLKAYEDYFK